MDDLSRRNVLQAVGAATIGTAVGPGVVGGHPGHINLTDGCDSCPPGTEVLVKYEWDEDNQEFEVEGCDALEFTDLDTDSDGELHGVDFVSELYFDAVRVKTGNAKGDACDSLDRSQVMLDPDPKDGEYHGSLSTEQIGEEDAISFIALCSAVCFQVDLVFGEHIEDLGEDDEGFYSGRKIAHLWGNTQTRRLSGTQATTKTWEGCTVSTTDTISADFATGMASVDFNVEDGGPCTLSLVSYVAPCPIGFTKETADRQHRYKWDTDEFDGSGSLSIKIPTRSDLLAVCEEAQVYTE